MTRAVVSALLIALWCASTSACAVRPSAKAGLPETIVEDTTLGPGDVFDVRVFGEQALTGKFQVGLDGTVRYPFLGSISVGGKDVDQVAEEIAVGLKKGQFLLDPQVYVFVEQANSKRVSVLGAVARPGTLPITPGMTVVHALSTAGGFTPLASKDDTVVTRRVNGRLERFRVPLSQISRGDADDFALRAGDIVFVPERVF